MLKNVLVLISVVFKCYWYCNTMKKFGFEFFRCRFWISRIHPTDFFKLSVFVFYDLQHFGRIVAGCTETLYFPRQYITKQRRTNTKFLFLNKHFKSANRSNSTQTYGKVHTTRALVFLNDKLHAITSNL